MATWEIVVLTVLAILFIPLILRIAVIFLAGIIVLAATAIEAVADDLRSTKRRKNKK